MKLDLRALKYYYESLDKEDLEELDIHNFKDFEEYIVSVIVSNLEYDFGKVFYDYVDFNNFIKEEN